MKRSVTIATTIGGKSVVSMFIRRGHLPPAFIVISRQSATLRQVNAHLGSNT